MRSMVEGHSTTPPVTPAQAGVQLPSRPRMSALSPQSTAIRSYTRCYLAPTLGGWPCPQPVFKPSVLSSFPSQLFEAPWRRPS